MSEQVSAAERVSAASSAGASERVSSANGRANEQASSPVQQSGFMVDLAHSAIAVAAVAVAEADWQIQRVMTKMVLISNY